MCYPTWMHWTLVRSITSLRICCIYTFFFFFLQLCVVRMVTLLHSQPWNFFISGAGWFSQFEVSSECTKNCSFFYPPVNSNSLRMLCVWKKIHDTKTEENQIIWFFESEWKFRKFRSLHVSETYLVEYIIKYGALWKFLITDTQLWDCAERFRFYGNRRALFE